jgi:hypothetical protein
MLQIFMARKNLSLLARTEPMNLGFNGKHDNHCTTKNNQEEVTYVVMEAKAHLKCQSISVRLHATTSQMAAIFIPTSVGT